MVDDDARVGARLAEIKDARVDAQLAEITDGKVVSPVGSEK